MGTLFACAKLYSCCVGLVSCVSRWVVISWHTLNHSRKMLFQSINNETSKFFHHSILSSQFYPLLGDILTEDINILVRNSHWLPTHFGIVQFQCWRIQPRQPQNSFCLDDHPRGGVSYGSVAELHQNEQLCVVRWADLLA